MRTPLARPHVAPHRAAMEAMDEALRARKSRDSAAERDALLRAVSHEAQAASLVPGDLEPTRSVLFRSAASIAVELGDTIQARRLAIRGLQGNAPPDIQSELVELLADLVPASGDVGNAAITQQLRIRQASTPSRALRMPFLAEIQGAWFRMLDAFTGWSAQPVFLDAGAGSFVVRFEIQGSDQEQAQLQMALAELQDVSQLLGAPRGREATTKAQASQFQRVRRVLELLTVLTDANVVLEVTTHTGSQVASLELRPPRQVDLESWQNAAAGSISSSDVPQADDLEKVLRFVEFVSRGRYPTPEMLDVVGRQVNYYRRAAEILGLLRDRILTPSGRILARMSGQDRWRLVLENVTTSQVGSAWIDWSGQNNFLDIEPKTSEAFLEATAIGLSSVTLRRRALTLSTWHAKLKAETD